MKKFNTYFFLLLVTISFAQKDFNTGNLKMDSDLRLIDSIANLSTSGFKKYLISTENISEKKYNQINSALKISPSEIYFLLEISKIGNTTIDKVLAFYESDFEEKGWPYIMTKCNIDSSSLNFHQLKMYVDAFKQNQQARVINERL